eukprot:639357-Pelagomonas_calceolata.AAC.2
MKANVSKDCIWWKTGMGSPRKRYKGYKGKRPQSRRLTANLFINAHEIMKEKGKASCGRRGDIEKRSCAQKVRHTSDGESLGRGTGKWKKRT